MTDDRSFDLVAVPRFHAADTFLYPANDLYPAEDLFPAECPYASLQAVSRSFALVAEQRFDETVLLVTIGCPLYPGCPLFPGCRTYPMLRAE